MTKTNTEAVLGFRKCKRCGAVLPLSQFKTVKGGFRFSCATCARLNSSAMARWRTSCRKMEQALEASKSAEEKEREKSLIAAGTHRVCSHCGKVKPLSDFLTLTGVRQPACSECMQKKRTAKRKENEAEMEERCGRHHWAVSLDECRAFVPQLMPPIDKERAEIVYKSFGGAAVRIAPFSEDETFITATKNRLLYGGLFLHRKY
jgi:hypothetical protein